jgi:hypothetical protein
MKKVMMLLLFMTAMSQAMERSEGKYFVSVRLPSDSVLRQYLLGAELKEFFRWFAKENGKSQRDNFVELLEICFRDSFERFSPKEREIAKQRSAKMIAFLRNYPQVIQQNKNNRRASI